MHISDLHIGKKLFETSMLEDQRYILNRILDLLDDERPDAVLIAGVFMIAPIRLPTRWNCWMSF